MKEVVDFLQHYDVDWDRGFLPVQDPLLQLPARYSPWEEIASECSALLNAGMLRTYLKKLPILGTDELYSTAELERAMLLLSVMGNAFVWGGQAADYLPAGVAVPWEQIANRLGRKPILSHASLALQNWRRLDPTGPVQTGNIATLIQFYGGLDESWFCLITTEMEQIGATAMRSIVEAQVNISRDHPEEVQRALEKIFNTLDALKITLERMYEHCDPYIFYNRLRPFLASFENIRYEGVKGENIRSYHGGSAAQSSLFQSFDAALGVRHEKAASNTFLVTMQKYMPPKHAAFIQAIADGPSIQMYCQKHTCLDDLYKGCLEALITFRNVHLRIVGDYIMAQAKNKIGPGATGTGGTNPMFFLKDVRNDTVKQTGN